MRVMLDTNIIISYILFNNERMDLFFNYLLRHDTLVISNIIIDELKEVFDKKFPHKKDVLNTFLEDIEVEHVNINEIDNHNLFEIRDAKDYPVLYAAIKSNVDIFVTGDKDFSDLNIKSPKIMSVKDYIMTYALR